MSETRESFERARSLPGLHGLIGNLGSLAQQLAGEVVLDDGIDGGAEALAVAAFLDGDKYGGHPGGFELLFEGDGLGVGDERILRAMDDQEWGVVFAGVLQGRGAFGLVRILRNGSTDQFRRTPTDPGPSAGREPRG